jgi:hypothetical protein
MLLAPFDKLFFQNYLLFSKPRLFQYGDNLEQWHCLAYRKKNYRLSYKFTISLYDKL